MTNLKYVAPCLFGVEGICAFELERMGAKNVKAENGKVNFEGDFNILARANINSRYAERILINAMMQKTDIANKDTVLSFSFCSNIAIAKFVP